MEVQIGRVTHYYSHLKVAVLELHEGLKLGDRIHIRGHATDLIESVTSMEVDHGRVLSVEPGANVAIRVHEPVHVNDVVLRVVGEPADAQPA